MLFKSACKLLRGLKGKEKQLLIEKMNESNLHFYRENFMYIFIYKTTVKYLGKEEKCVSKSPNQKSLCISATERKEAAPFRLAFKTVTFQLLIEAYNLILNLKFLSHNG